MLDGLPNRALITDSAFFLPFPAVFLVAFGLAPTRAETLKCRAEQGANDGRAGQTGVARATGATIRAGSLLAVVVAARDCKAVGSIANGGCKGSWAAPPPYEKIPDEMKSSDTIHFVLNMVINTINTSSAWASLSAMRWQLAVTRKLHPASPGYKIILLQTKVYTLVLIRMRYQLKANSCLQVVMDDPGGRLGRR